MTDTTGQKRVPNVRFKGFTDDWEQRTLGKKVTFYSGLTYHPQDVKENGYFVIRSSNIQDSSLVAADNVYVSEKIVNSEKVKQGDIIVVVRNGSRSLIGKHAIVKSDLPDTVIGAFMTGIRSKQNNYINALLDSDKFKREIHKNLGATINQITTGEFKKMKFNFANDVSESVKIGELFLKLDKVISLYQQKLSLLKQLKQGMLQKLFTNSENKQPLLRFNEFHGDWEQRKFLDAIDKIIDFRGRTPKKLGMNWSDAGYLALSALNVKKGYVDLSSSDAHYGDDELYNKWMRGNELHQGQVLLTTEAPMGNVAQVPDTAKYILSQRTIAFETKLNENFLAIVLSTSTVQNRLKALSTGGTATGVSQKSLKFLSIKFPNLDEQRRLGEIFTTLNKSITLYQNKTNTLTNLKKFLLQQMFI